MIGKNHGSHPGAEEPGDGGRRGRGGRRAISSPDDPSRGPHRRRSRGEAVTSAADTAAPLVSVLNRELRTSLVGAGIAADYAAELLGSLGAAVERSGDGAAVDPAIEWARSGAMALTGTAEGPPLLAPGPLAACARGAADAFALLAGGNRIADLDGPALLGERAAIFGLSRRGAISPGGSCRLLRAADRWLALNLARPDDVALLPAWLGGGEPLDRWRFAADGVAGGNADALVDRARLLGLPAAVAAPPAAVAPPWCRLAAAGMGRATPRPRPLVVDLSALWAGPLCTQLLGLAGARVVKVESTRRPDGARAGPQPFWQLMNAGKASVALDFRTDAGRERLLRLVERADIVVESARPRALEQLGIDAGAQVAGRRGLTWVSITGYGRREPGAGWVAFGDDAAVAAGLAAATGGEDAPLFCGDAIADPLAGLHAAVAAWASWRSGGGHLLDLALCDVTAHALAFAPQTPTARVLPAGGGGGWEVVAADERVEVAAPRARAATGSARSLGADTTAVLRELGIPC
jgi:hypothetical protein